MPAGSEIQDEIFLKLVQILGPAAVVREWSIRRSAADTFSEATVYAYRYYPL